MKKTIALILCLLMGFLCACSAGGGDAETGTVPSSQPEISSKAEAGPSEQNEMSEPAETSGDETPTEPETPTVDPDAYPWDLARDCIGAPVEELYALVGEPESKEYGPSCFGEGEDGQLYYADFIVYTYRFEGEEIVQDVE